MFIVTGARADTRNLLILSAPLTTTARTWAFVAVVGSRIDNEDIESEPSPITDTSKLRTRRSTVTFVRHNKNQRLKIKDEAALSKLTTHDCCVPRRRSCPPAKHRLRWDLMRDVAPAAHECF